MSPVSVTLTEQKCPTSQAMEYKNTKLHCMNYRWFLCASIYKHLILIATFSLLLIVFLSGEKNLNIERRNVNLFLPEIDVADTTFARPWSDDPHCADSVASYYNFKKANKLGRRGEAHSFVVHSDAYLTKEFDNHVTQQIQIWEQVAKRLIFGTRDLLVIFYEDLKAKPVMQIKRMLRFLKVESSPRRMACVKHHLEGTAHRKHDNIDPFTVVQKIHLAESMADIVGLLKLRNIEPPDEYVQFITNYTFIPNLVW